MTSSDEIQFGFAEAAFHLAPRIVPLIPLIRIREPIYNFELA